MVCWTLALTLCWYVEKNHVTVGEHHFCSLWCLRQIECSARQGRRWWKKRPVRVTLEITFSTLLLCFIFLFSGCWNIDDSLVGQKLDHIRRCFHWSALEREKRSVRGEKISWHLEIWSKLRNTMKYNTNQPFTQSVTMVSIDLINFTRTWVPGNRAA